MNASTTANSLGDSLRRLAAARQGRRPAVDHPSFERFVAYHAGRLAPDEEALIHDHLLSCARCPALVLELEELSRADSLRASAPRGGEALADAAGAASVAGAAAGVAPAAEAGRVTPAVAAAADGADDRAAAALRPTRATELWAARPAPARIGAGAGLALACCLFLVAALSASAERDRHGQQVAAIVETTALRVMRGAGAEHVAVRGDRFVLTFNDLRAGTAPGVQVEVLDRAGHSRWLRRTASSTPPHSVAVEMSRDFLPAGSYSFVISEAAPDGGAGSVLGRYEVDLSYA